MTYLFDQQKAMDALARWRSNGAARWPSATRGSPPFRGAQDRAPPAAATAGMISSAIIPQPLAKLPWRLIFLVARDLPIGILTLYSAAGGSISPWALKQAHDYPGLPRHRDRHVVAPAKHDQATRLPALWRRSCSC